MHRWVLLAVLATLLIPQTVHAQEQPLDKGLFITPPRQYLEADPGKNTKSSITVANLTENSVDVALSVRQFSVADYTYDYTFQLPKENWVRLEKTQLSLSKTESRTITYDIAVPKNTTPGGHYFTILASMSPREGKVVQAATVIYVTVKGELVKTSTVDKRTLPFISFGGDIPYSMEVRNTGNDHFFVYLSGKLTGLSAQPSKTEVAHLLLPQTVRRVEGSITAPLIPGVYQAEYGFKHEDGHETIYRQLIIYLPFWALALIIGVAWFTLTWFRRHKKLRTTDS